MMMPLLGIAKTKLSSAGFCVCCWFIILIDNIIFQQIDFPEHTFILLHSGQLLLLEISLSLQADATRENELPFQLSRVPVYLCRKIRSVVKLLKAINMNGKSAISSCLIEGFVWLALSHVHLRKQVPFHSFIIKLFDFQKLSFREKRDPLNNLILSPSNWS